jgi:hypothetical protein
MPETITIPRAWLERLIEISKDMEVNGVNPMVLKYLYGYIESAKSLLDKE